jgi:hypothetical protein
MEEATSNPTIEKPSDNQKPLTLYHAQVRPVNGTGSKSLFENPLSGTKDDGSGCNSARSLKSCQLDGINLVVQTGQFSSDTAKPLH